MRIGYVPKVFGWTGCYIDHMSKEAFDAHWARVMSPLLSSLTVAERMALKGVMCDSWEAGTVSWTEAFPQEFRRRRGYDVLPWLPVKSGLPIGEPAQRQRFERDFALTVGELIAENHYAYQKEVANREAGLDRGGGRSPSEAWRRPPDAGSLRRGYGRVLDALCAPLRRHPAVHGA